MMNVVPALRLLKRTVFYVTFFSSMLRKRELRITQSKLAGSKIKNKAEYFDLISNNDVEIKFMKQQFEHRYNIHSINNRVEPLPISFEFENNNLYLENINLKLFTSDVSQSEFLNMFADISDTSDFKLFTEDSHAFEKKYASLLKFGLTYLERFGFTYVQNPSFLTHVRHLCNRELDIAKTIRKLRHNFDLRDTSVEYFLQFFEILQQNRKTIAVNTLIRLLEEANSQICFQKFLFILRLFPDNECIRPLKSEQYAALFAKNTQQMVRLPYAGLYDTKFIRERLYYGHELMGSNKNFKF